MRPLRFLLLLAFFVVLPVVLTCWSLFASADSAPSSIHAGYNTGSSRLRALFSFSTPSSLFPPSALISLTNDNSTFFLARPAAFGPSLPAKGLSGQLWVGKGFGDDALLKEENIHIAGWELGCSDVPGWGEDETKRLQPMKNLDNTPPTKRSSDPKSQDSGSHTPDGAVHDAAPDTMTDENPQDDGTDDYLHHPLPDSNPATPAQPGEPANVDASDKNKKPTHADIESLQESADIAGKIVMLSRGGCGFLEKVKWAQRRGGIALIVGDNERGGQLTIMYAKGDTSNVTIPALFTSYTSAHLLSSLVPPESGEDEDKNSKAADKIGDIKVQANRRPALTSTKSIGRQPTIVPAGTEPGGDGTGQNGWVKNVLSAVGLNDNSPFSHSEDSRRPPSSGNIDWILLEDWDDDDWGGQMTSNSQTRTHSRRSTSATSTVKAKSTSLSRRPAGDDFVIGVQDWRDTDLVAPKPTPSPETDSSKVQDGKEPLIQSASSAKSPAPVETALKGGSITPGSGEYDHVKAGHSNKAGGQSKKSPSSGHSHEQGSSIGDWFSFFRPKAAPCGHKHSPVKQAQQQHDQAHAVQHNIPAKHAAEDAPQQEGLWVTLTPTSASTSPFFDTLLVLVVSPLVTLTVVYALLLLRSRIRRRRWRAPKSVVERLPVRTYHTMSTTSSTTSSQIPSPDRSSPSSPLLLSAPQDVSRRTRPRSQTTAGIFSGTSLDGRDGHSRSPPPEKPSAPFTKRKRYSGRQVECVVCLEEYIDGESQVMSLPCGHEFHAECITPWLVTRRRTCPICKGDVVRSLAQTGSGRWDEDQSTEGDETTDDVRSRVAQSVNREPSAAIPIPVRESGEMANNEDVERGQAIEESTADRQPPERQSVWRNISASVSRLSGDTVWGQTPVDRNR